MGHLETDLAPATLRCQRLRNCQRARRFCFLKPRDIVFPIKSIADFNDAGRNSGHKVRSCLYGAASSGGSFLPGASFPKTWVSLSFK
jgi:hypothetical protein